MLAAGVLAGSHIFQFFDNKPFLDESNDKTNLLKVLIDTWVKNQPDSPSSYILVNEVVLKKKEEIKLMIRTDFDVGNTISHDGFVFSLSEFAIAITLLSNAISLNQKV